MQNLLFASIDLQSMDVMKFDYFKDCIDHDFFYLYRCVKKHALFFQILIILLIYILKIIKQRLILYFKIEITNIYSSNSYYTKLSLYQSLILSNRINLLKWQNQINKEKER